MYICEYDTTCAPFDREYITSYAQELFPQCKEIPEQYYEQCLTTAVNNGQYADSMQEFGNVHTFVLNEIEYFCIVLNPGLNGEQWFYGKKAYQFIQGC